MSELLDAHGKPITVGCMVRHTRPDTSLGLVPARVREIIGHSVVVDKLIQNKVETKGGRYRTFTSPPVFLGSLVEVVA